MYCEMKCHEAHQYMPVSPSMTLKDFLTLLVMVFFLLSWVYYIQSKI